MQVQQDFVFRLEAPSNATCTTWIPRSGWGIAGTSLICFMWFNEDPQTTRGTPTSDGCRPTQKTFPAKSFPDARITAAQGKELVVEVGGGRAPVLLMHFCVVCTAVN